jgi:hypothetical protein
VEIEPRRHAPEIVPDHSSDADFMIGKGRKVETRSSCSGQWSSVVREQRKKPTGAGTPMGFS